MIRDPNYYLRKATLFRKKSDETASSTIPPKLNRLGHYNLERVYYLQRKPNGFTVRSMGYSPSVRVLSGYPGYYSYDTEMIVDYLRL